MKTNLSEFHNCHAGETCVIVGIGPNLELTPPELFDFPTFGINTLYKRGGEWKPTYFVGVDIELLKRDGAALVEAYKDVPKFFPRPDFDELQGDNIYRFVHRTGIELVTGGKLANRADALTHTGITYRRIMDAVFQIAYHMGFTTMLMIGLDHGDRKDHFWGRAEYEPQNDFMWEEIGYAECLRMMNSVKVLNISEKTHVPESIIPRGNWRDWIGTDMRVNHIEILTTPTLICSGSAPGHTIIITNTSAHGIFVGNSNVTILDGFEVPKDQVVSIPLAPNDDLYGVADTTAVTISYIKVDR